jgi:dsDNA-specific endonuclease/ATPase MutS2
MNIMKYKDFDGGEKYDLHGRSIEDLDRLIDRLSMSEKVVHIITGSGSGKLKMRLHQLQKVYKFKILLTSSNDAAFTVDFR